MLFAALEKFMSYAEYIEYLLTPSLVIITIVK